MICAKRLVFLWWLRAGSGVMQNTAGISRDEERISLQKREVFRDFRHQDGRLVRHGRHLVEAHDFTGMLMQSDPKSVGSLTRYGRNVAVFYFFPSFDTFLLMTQH